MCVHTHIWELFWKTFVYIFICIFVLHLSVLHLSLQHHTSLANPSLSPCGTRQVDRCRYRLSNSTPSMELISQLSTCLHGNNSVASKHWLDTSTAELFWISRHQVNQDLEAVITRSRTCYRLLVMLLLIITCSLPDQQSTNSATSGDVHKWWDNQINSPIRR